MQRTTLVRLILNGFQSRFSVWANEWRWRSHTSKSFRRDRRGLRSLRFEYLDHRYLFTLEGEVFSFNQPYDTSGISGDTSGSVLWADGSTTGASVSASPAAGPLSIKLDYSLDSSGFFGPPERRAILQQVVDSVVGKFSDQLLAITPGGTSQWTLRIQNPSTGAQINPGGPTIAANQILVFVGARNLNSGELGRGEVGGYNITTTSQAFADAVQARGQAGALTPTKTDYGPWGGTIAFSSTANWHFGATTQGLDATESDFASVAAHEILHVLGFGLSASWIAKVQGGSFVGSNASSINGGSVPLAGSAHWQQGIKSNGLSVAMSPESIAGVRKLPTRLDLAGMQDIGWQLINPTVTVSASHTYGDNGNFAAALILSGSSFGSISYPISVAVTNAAPVFIAQTNQSAVASQPFSLSRIGQFTDAGFGSSQATPPTSETFTYSIDWGDGTTPSAGNAIIESVGSAGVLTKGFFNGTHTYVAQGTYRVLQTVTDDDGSSVQQQFSVVVGPVPSIELTIDRNTIAENAGAGAAFLTIRRLGFNTAVATTIVLTNSDITELQVQSSVDIPAGQSTLVVPVNSVDDALLDGTVRVLIAASAGAIVSNTLPVDVLDAEQISIVLNVVSISENAGAGAAILTVSRSNTDISQPITLQLTSNDTTEATLPRSVIIPAGSSQTTVGVDIVDDSLFDGSQTVLLTATSVGYKDGSATLTVTDYQPLSLVFQATELMEESTTKNKTQVEVSIRSPAPAGGVTVLLTTNLPTQLRIPASVVIPAGQLSAAFQVSVVDDFIAQGRRVARIFVSGNGAISNSNDIALSDNDIAYWTNPSNPLDVNNSGQTDPLDVLVLINEINANGPRTLDPGKDRGLQFVDTNGDGDISPLDVLSVINAINRVK
jgi:hypothetical protein